MLRAATNPYIGLLLFTAVSCGGVSDSRLTGRTPYQEDSTVIVGDPDGTRTVTTPDGTACIEVAGGCVSPQDECGDNGTADVIVDENGNLLDVVCYGQDVTVDEVPADQTGPVTAGNNTVVVLDGADDGVDVAGDLTIEGNNAIVYGDGPDTSVIGGDLKILKNDAIIRGVRIQGDVLIDKNNTKLLFCVIEGDLTIVENNTTIAECDVYGKVTLYQNNTVFVENRFNGTDVLSGMNNLQCSGNVRFDDTNMNLMVEEGELGGPVICE